MVFIKSQFYKEKGILVTNLKLHPELNFQGVILDFETTSYDTAEGKIICVGVLSEREAVSIVRTSKAKEEYFHNLIRDLIKSYLKKGYKLYAYNSPFEEKWLNEHLGLKVKVEEIMKPAKEITYLLRDKFGKHKYPKLRELIHPRLFSYFGFEKWDIDSQEVGKLWEQHLETNDINPLEWIAQHNLLDLLTEFELLTVWNPFMEKFLNNPSLVEEKSTLKCSKCNKEKPIEELAVVTYPERKPEGNFRFVEKLICKDCLEI